MSPRDAPGRSQGCRCRSHASPCPRQPRESRASPCARVAPRTRTPQACQMARQPYFRPRGRPACPPVPPWAPPSGTTGTRPNEQGYFTDESTLSDDDTGTSARRGVMRREARQKRRARRAEAHPRQTATATKSYRWNMTVSLFSQKSNPKRVTATCRATQTRHRHQHYVLSYTLHKPALGSSLPWLLRARHNKSVVPEQGFHVRFPSPERLENGHGRGSAAHGQDGGRELPARFLHRAFVIEPGFFERP